MQPPNEAICNLFVPLLITFGLLVVLLCQFAFSGDDF